MSHMRMMPVPPIHSTQNIKLMAVVHRLQQIMINENLTPDELVGCAGVVRDNHRKYSDISNPPVLKLVFSASGVEQRAPRDVSLHRRDHPQPARLKSVLLCNFPTISRFFSRACNRCIFLHALGMPVLAARRQSRRGSRVVMQLH